MRRRSLRCAAPSDEAGVLKPASELIVGSELRQVLLEAKRLEHPGIDAQGHCWITLFGAVERLPGDSCTLCDGLRRIPSPQPRELEIGADLLEEAAHAWQEWRSGTGHNESYCTHIHVPLRLL